MFWIVSIVIFGAVALIVLMSWLFTRPPAKERIGSLKVGDTVRCHDGIEREIVKDGTDGRDYPIISRSRDGRQSKSKVAIELTFKDAVVALCYPGDLVAARR